MAEHITILSDDDQLVAEGDHEPILLVKRRFGPTELESLAATVPGHVMAEHVTVLGGHHNLVAEGDHEPILDVEGDFGCHGIPFGLEPRDQGRLDFDRPVQNNYAMFAAARVKRITLRDYFLESH
jgi:hypothetical protein